MFLITEATFLSLSVISTISPPPMSSDQMPRPRKTKFPSLPDRQRRQMLLSDPATRTIFPELPLVSYRRDRNLTDYLVHSAERSDSDAGTFACRHPRCLTCRHTTSQTTLQSPKRLYTIRDRFTCQTERECGLLHHMSSLRLLVHW